MPEKNKDKALDVLNGISQASANAFDGALDPSGSPIKIGLRREEDLPHTERRYLDGFKVKIHGSQLIVNYQSEIKLSEVHDSKFESEIESVIASAVSWLKKEYKKITGNSLSLSKSGEANVFVQNISNVRSIVQASCVYDIGGLPDVEEVSQPSEDRLEKAVKDWLKLGKVDRLV